LQEFNAMGYFSLLLSPYKTFCAFCALLLNCGKKGRIYILKAKHRLPANVHIGDVRIIGKNFCIGEHSYFNSGHMASAPDAKISIGKWCAIGHNVTILAITHDTGIPTGDETRRPAKKGDVIIEDGVWIGSNAIITPGVHIGKQAVVGGNSVVTQDIPPFMVATGVPCKPLYKKSEEEINLHSELIK
jgi:acetyltransferase-like isoleucine patch superfamily enzyme